MRIAYVTADHGAPVFGRKGASVHIREMVRAFASLGHSVQVVAARLGEETEPLDAAIRVVPCPDGEIVAPADPAAGEAGRRLAKERRYVAVGKAAAAELVRLHAGRPFDVVYERHSLWSAAGVRAAREIGVPCVVEVNAPLLLEQRTYRRLILDDVADALERENFRDARAIATVSREVRDYVVARGGDPRRVAVIRNGVDTARFHPDVPPLSVDGLDDRPVIGFVGSLKPWHGLDVLMDAFRHLHRRGCPANLLIVGDGPERSWIEGYVRGAGLRERVFLTGWLEYGRMPAAIRRMDIAVAPYPAIEKFYFSPLKLYEYFAVGRPVVASAVGQVADVVRDGENGFLVPPGDAEALAERLAVLCRDAALRRRLGRSGTVFARSRTWRRNAEEVVDLARSARRAA